MLTDEQQSFVKYWGEQRNLPKKNLKQFLKGLSSGLIMGIGVVSLIMLGWYQRANMEFNSKLSPAILLIALTVIGLFMGFFYQNYRWEMNEQYYQELLIKQKKAERETIEKQRESSQSTN
jgi:hypothetical protein